MLLQKEVERLRIDIQQWKSLYGQAYAEARALMDRDSYELFVMRMDENRREVFSETPSAYNTASGKKTEHCEHIWMLSWNKNVRGTKCAHCSLWEPEAQKSPPSSSEHKDEPRTQAPNISEGARASDEFILCEKCGSDYWTLCKGHTECSRCGHWLERPGKKRPAKK